jgi:hypothetical protein
MKRSRHLPRGHPYASNRSTLQVMEASGVSQTTDAPTAEAAPRGRKRSGAHSGRLLLRMPESLHAELARASERAGMSLNAFITQTLSAAVQHRPSAAPSRPAPAAGRRPRGLDRLLIANLVVVAVVGVLAAVLLVQAIR